MRPRRRSQREPPTPIPMAVRRGRPSAALTCCGADRARRRTSEMPMRLVATLDGAEHQLEVEELSAHTLRLKLGERQFDLDVHRVGPSSYSILVDHRSFDFEDVREGEDLIVASRRGATRVTLVDAARKSRHPGARAQAAGKASLKAMMPGRVEIGRAHVC